MPEQDPGWGKMSRGQPYVIIATDLLRAFLALGLGELEGLILGHVIENTWGKAARKGRKGSPWPEAPPCTIPQSELARSFGVLRNSIWEAVQRLVKARILVKDERGYLINKDVSSWVHPTQDSPRLKEEFVVYAASARRAKRPRSTPPPVLPEQDTAVMLQHDKNGDRVMLEHDTPGPSVMLEHDTPEGSVMLQHDTPCRGSRARNPTGFNTNPTGLIHKHPEASVCPPPDGPLSALGLECLRITQDDGLAEVFDMQASSWLRAGATEADVREALLIAAGEGVKPRSFIRFVAGCLANIGRRRPLPAAGPPTVPIPAARPTKSQRDAAEFLRRREAMIAHQAAKEAARAEGQ